MYVLMDIEWITNNDNHICPTQIAALRVDEQWNEIERYFARIRPRDSSFHDWKHMGYSGGKAAQFLCADGLAKVLNDLDSWLHEDDVLCWWTPESINILNSMFLLILRRRHMRKHIVLHDFVYPFLTAKKMVAGGAYKIADAYDIPKFEPRHHALNDALTMRSVLSAVKFPTRLFEKNSEVKKEVIQQPAMEDWPYQYDETNGVVHRKGCTEIPLGVSLKDFISLRTCMKRNYTPCQCVKEEYAQLRRERNQDIINRVEYQFIYTDNTNIFHRRDCKRILNTTGTIMGSVYYDGCARLGKCACKVCNPQPGEYLSTKAWKKAKKKAPVITLDSVVPQRSLTSGEKHAYTRFVAARGERLAGSGTEFKTVTERNDFYTLTQPRFAFFHAAGYKTFHQRTCKKLKGLSNITGFSYYKDAVRSGHTPCKYCKPTAKQNINFAIPITNEKRGGETISAIQALCAEYGYPCELQKHFFCFVTPAGRWKIDVSANPYVVYHINRVKDPRNESGYHRQPRLFLSLVDTFEYIQRHDASLMETRAFG